MINRIETKREIKKLTILDTTCATNEVPLVFKKSDLFGPISRQIFILFCITCIFIICHKIFLCYTKKEHIKFSVFELYFINLFEISLFTKLRSNFEETLFTTKREIKPSIQCLFVLVLLSDSHLGAYRNLIKHKDLKLIILFLLKALISLAYGTVLCRPKHLINTGTS
ncbi:hypothetical protein BpHYR1_031634 [Brachionus plicatilis]|uniref:Uncharacterized protein n=1 Tax=Brachionus plicatilis TaxID=10195 RepID=A0A3M7S553_BRAPC|nr:hypothetical protein BpHYR1_031634 [Brachionus plicatilis]